MKVSINETFEVTDAQRIQLSNVNDEKLSKRKATRDEFKAFIKAEGLGDWEAELASQWAELFGPASEEPEGLDADEPDAEDDDLIGGDDDPMDLI